MKLKCDDGVVRHFEVCKPADSFYHSISEAYCAECLQSFDYHDTPILKPMFRAHVCKGALQETKG